MKSILYRLFEHQYLGKEEARVILQHIAEGRYTDAQIASLITVFLMRSISVEELTGFREALLEMRVPVDLQAYRPIDIVGTGGDGKNTFNISTCAAFVMAGAGYKVTKHGNGGSSSVSGASNVLQAHGVKFTDNIDQLKRSLDTAGICYFHAPLFAYGMKFVGPVRKALATPTCFNLLGPLVNPCTPKNSLLGTANQAQLRLYTNALQRIGNNFGVVTSHDGYDEISLTSGFKVCTNYFEKVLTPVDLGLSYVKQSDIYGGDTQESAAKIFDSVLDGTSTEAQKNVVIANAACGMSIVTPSIPMSDTIAMARESLDSGKALEAFKKFVEINS